MILAPHTSLWLRLAQPIFLSGVLLAVACSTGSGTLRDDEGARETSAKPQLSASASDRASTHAAAEHAATEPMADDAWSSKSEAEWRARLSEQEFDVLREEGTERAFSGEFHDHHAAGTYVCAGCGLPLYRSGDKFDSGTGWPSYTRAIDGAVETETDRSLGMARTEVHCRRCGGHLGHIFPDGPEPTGMRHCINSVSLDFQPTP